MLLSFTNWLVYQVLGMSESSVFAGALDFFIYDSIKILFLLYVMIFVIGVLRTFVPKNKIKHWMTNKGILGNVYASLFGAVTPFCSCSSLPVFLSFLKAGIPLGTALAFMMAVSALSLPEAIMLRRAMKLNLILAFFGIVAADIILIGYVFNFPQIVLTS